MTWVVIIAVGTGSFLFRIGPMTLLRRLVLTAAADRAIRYAGVAALSALIVVSGRGAATGSAAIPTLLALTASLVGAARGRSMLRVVAWGGGIYAGATMAADLLAR